MARTSRSLIGILGASLLAWGSVACGNGSLARPPFTCPEKGGASWTEVTSAHFTLQTDLDAGTAQEVSAQLESMFSALADLGFDSAIEMRTHMDVVYFRQREEYQRVAPKMSSGVFRWEFHDFERRPLAILYGDFVQRTRTTVQHELAHFFVHAHYPQAPSWLNEGLAEYFSTLEIADGTAVLGRAPRSGRFWKGPWNLEMLDGEYSAKIPLSEAPSVGALLAMDGDAFYGELDRDPNDPRALDQQRSTMTHYAGAWSLVHLLMVDPNYRPRFDAYKRRLLEGKPSDAAWHDTLGEVPAPTLEHAYASSLAGFETQMQRTKYAPAAAPAGRVRTLSDADVHVLWARIRHWETPEDRAATEADLKEAAAHEPLHPALAELTAYWKDAQNDLTGAEKALQPALDARPNDARLLNAMGWIEFQAIAKKERPMAALAPIATRLAPLAKTASEFDLLARSSAMRGDMDAGLAYEKRAVTADPSCYACFFHAARMLNEKGRTREALHAATLAQSLLPDGVRMPAIRTAIADYRRRLSASGDESSARTPPTQ